MGPSVIPVTLAFDDTARENCPLAAGAFPKTDRGASRARRGAIQADVAPILARVAPNPSRRGAKPKPTWRPTQILTNFFQQPPIAFLSLFKRLAALARGVRPCRPSPSSSPLVRIPNAPRHARSRFWLPRLSRTASDFCKRQSGAYSVGCWSGHCRLRAGTPPSSWPSSTRPSTPRRRKYESAAARAYAVRGKSLQCKRFWPRLLTCGRSMRRTAWMVGTSPAITLNRPVDLSDPPELTVTNS
jgi:hypothetical protein